MDKFLSSMRSVCSKEAFNMETNPLDVVRALGPSLVPFFKTVAIYFVLDKNITNKPLFAVIKCLPVLSLIIFVAMHYRTRLAPKKMGDLRKLQLLQFDAIPAVRSSSSADVPAKANDSEQQTAPRQVETSTSETSQSDNIECSVRVAILRSPESRYARLIFIGLLLSLAGDVCLVWAAELFLCGMILFALAHCAYAAAFSFAPPNPLGFLFVLVFGLVYHWFMQVNFVGVFAFAAPVYTVLIGTMWWRALSRLKLGAEFWKWTAIASCFGATLFAMSDALLGIARFAGGFAHVETLVMLTYYAAQFGIAVSVIDTHRDSVSSSQLAPSSINKKRD